MNKIYIIIIIILSIAVIILSKQKDLFYTAVGKIESDSDYCLNTQEIKAIQNAPVTDEYKNYLFESDMHKRQAINENKNLPVKQANYINCEL
jgi:hypothetical protein